MSHWFQAGNEAPISEQAHRLQRRGGVAPFPAWNQWLTVPAPNQATSAAFHAALGADRPQEWFYRCILAPLLAGTMQLPDRRRPGGSRRWKSVRSILTRAFGSPFRDSVALAKVLAPPHLKGVSRRDGGATTASFRFSEPIGPWGKPRRSPVGTP